MAICLTCIIILLPKCICMTISYVNIKNAGEVDGTLLSEVSKGKDGVKVKLADRMKAIQWISDHMDLATPEQQEKVKLLQAQRRKLESDKDDGENDQVVIINDV